MKSTSVICILSLLLAGCHTGTGRAQAYCDLLSLGMSQSEVRTIVGEPESIEMGPRMASEDGPVKPTDPAIVVEWHYTWYTPFTMYIIPTALFFTLVFTYPALWFLLGIGMTSQGHLHVGFGVDGKVIKKWVDPVGGF